MAKELERKKDKNELPEDKRKKFVYNEDCEIEWLDWAKGKNADGTPKIQHNAAGTKSIVNHQAAAKLVKMGKAKITRENVRRKTNEDPKSISKV